MVLKQLTDRVAVIPGGVNIGVLIGDHNEVALIDTGLNETAARKALKVITNEFGSSVVAVLNTHAHADHFGGNATVVKRCGAKVFAPQVDEAIIRNPLFQPVMMFGGAEPPESLRGGFLLADASPVDEVYGESAFSLLGCDVQPVRLPGHSPGQCGLLIDDVFFCADVVLPSVALEKYRIPYLFSISDHLESLQRAGQTTCQWAVPGHGDTMVSMETSIEENRQVVHQLLEWTLSAVSDGTSTEDIVAEVLTVSEAQVTSESAYYLARPSVLASLQYLLGKGSISAGIEENRPIWRRN